MGIRTSKAVADRLAREAGEQRLARKQHASRAVSILGRRMSSPAGLAVSFGAGFVTGYRPEDRSDDSAGDGNAEDRRGLLQRLMDGPVQGIATRLAVAALVRGMFPPQASPAEVETEPMGGEAALGDGL